MPYRALLAGFHVYEVPIVFRERRAGTSKMSARIALEAVSKVPGLRVRCGERARAPRADRRYGVTRSSGRSVTSPTTAASSPRASSSATRASRRSRATAMSSPPLVCGS